MFNGTIDANGTKKEFDDIVCKNGLLQHNIDKTNGLLMKPGVDINLVGRDEEGNIVGGIMCNTFLMILYIDVLWVHESYRGQGLGYKLITEAENTARGLGCIYAHTSTSSYQSPDFYKRQGYEVYAINDWFPDNICTYLLRKKL